jgi:outer membrane protein
MNKIALGLAFATLPLTLAAPAQAQRNSAILIVDTERVLTECTACVAAGTAINTQVQQGQQLAQQLSTPLQTEGQAIQTAVNALNGKAADAALQKRITDFRAREEQAQQQLAQRQNVIRSTQAHVNQQLGTRLITVIEQIRNTRGAQVVLSKNSTLANVGSVEVTTEVLAEFNRQVPAVSVTPLPQSQTPAAQPATPRPATPTGR